LHSQSIIGIDPLSITEITLTVELTSGDLDGEHYTPHHDEVQTQGKKIEECGGTAVAAEVSRIQLNIRRVANAADCTKGDSTV
jgi:hypothetical protein